MLIVCLQQAYIQVVLFEANLNTSHASIRTTKKQINHELRNDTQVQM